MRVIFTRLARLELDAATDHYETEFPGLGRRFRSEVKKAARRISAYPKAWSADGGSIRKYVLHTFPYNLLYSIEEEEILVLAVAHQHRQPHYWVDRNDP